MRVVNIHGVDDVRLDPVAAPAPGSKDVVVQVKACGICGSDLTYIKIGGIHRRPGGVTPIGHEAAGEVISVGADVKGVAVGQRVVINPMMTSSYVGSGGPEGAFTEELLIRDARVGESLLPIPEDLPYDVAALTEPLAVALHGVNRAEVKSGDKVVVFGCGPIGLSMVLWLIDRGVTDVVALDLSAERLERAKALGARAIINPAKEDVRARLLELHGSARVFSRESVGTDAYIDAAGAPNHPVRCRQNGQISLAHGGDGGVYEAGAARLGRHADHRNDHHHRGGLSHRDGGSDCLAAPATRQSPVVDQPSLPV